MLELALENPECKIFSLQRELVRAGNEKKTEFYAMMQKETSCSFKDALENLNETISVFIPHHYRKRWQRNQEAILVKKMTSNDKYSRVLQTISDFGKAITVEFKMSTQNQWFRQKKVELFVSVSRHVNPDQASDKRIITCAHIFFSNSKFKNGDDVGFYYSLIFQKMKNELGIAFTHFMD